MSKKIQLYAVYGSLMKGLGNHRCIEGAKFVGEGHTAPSFTLLDLGSFPGLLMQGDTSVKYEVYEVTEPLMEQRVDRLEGYRGVDREYDNFYNKRVIETQYGEAFIYEVNKRYSNHLDKKINSGDWRTHYNNK